MRETKKFKTSFSGVEVEMVTYLTAGEMQAIAAIGATGEDKDMKNNVDAANKLAEVVVYSLDGNKEDILKRVLEMRVEDYNELVQHATELLKGLQEESMEKKEVREQ